MAIRCLLILAALLLSHAAAAQSVVQSGTITAGSVPRWVSNGVIGGGVTASDSPVTSFGVTSNSEAGFCVSSGRSSAAGRQQLCFGAPLSSNAKITLQNYGSAVAQGLDIVINGVTTTVTTLSGTANRLAYWSTSSAIGSLGAGTNGQALLGQTGAAPAFGTISGDASVTNAGVWTNSKVNAVSYPASPSTNTVPVVTSSNVVTYQTVPVAAGGTNCAVASGTCLDNITGFSSTGIASRTGSGTYSFSTFTALMDAGVGSTQGNIAYRNATVWTVLAPGTDGQVLQTKGAGQNPIWFSVAGTGTVTSITCNGGLTGGAITTSGTCAVDIATAGNFEAGTASKILDAAVVFTSETTTSFSTTPTFDLNTFINTKITLTDNISSVTMSNIKAGQCGNIRFIQDGTGSRTLPGTFNANFKFAGGTQPVLSTAASAIDVMPFCCSATNYCVGSLIRNVQ